MKAKSFRVYYHQSDNKALETKVVEAKNRKAAIEVFLQENPDAVALMAKAV